MCVYAYIFWKWHLSLPHNIQCSIFEIIKYYNISPFPSSFPELSYTLIAIKFMVSLFINCYYIHMCIHFKKLEHWRQLQHINLLSVCKHRDKNKLEINIYSLANILWIFMNWVKLSSLAFWNLFTHYTYQMLIFICISNWFY